MGQTPGSSVEKKKRNKNPSDGFIGNTEEEQSTVIVYRPLVSLLKRPGEMGLGGV